MLIESFTIGYSNDEDRLLLQVVTKPQPHQYWVSRRAAVMLAEAIHGIFVVQYATMGVQTNSNVHLSAVSSFEHDSALQKHPINSHPDLAASISESPLLLYQVKYAAVDADVGKISLLDRHDAGFTYLLKRELLHAFLHLLQTQCDQAGWNLKLTAHEKYPPNSNVGVQHALH